MRKKLADIKNERKRFRGIFDRFGKKSGWKGRVQETLLLLNVTTLENEPVTDHLWFNLTEEFFSLRLEKGDVIEFDARVKEYTKGYVNRLGRIDNRKTDFKLSHPTKVSKVVKDSHG